MTVEHASQSKRYPDSYVPDEVIDYILAHRSSGAGIRELERETGVNRNTVMRLVKMYGAATLPDPAFYLPRKPVQRVKDKRSTGRPRVARSRLAVCIYCRVPFRYLFYPSRGRKSFCCRSHHLAHQRELRRKVPNDFGLLYSLYWDQNQSLPTIARRFNTDATTVRVAMDKLGIPRRRRTSRLHCLVDECSELVHKVLHRKNGSWYGQRCLAHWVAHRAHVQSQHWHHVLKWRNRGADLETSGV